MRARWHERHHHHRRVEHRIQAAQDSARQRDGFPSKPQEGHSLHETDQPGYHEGAPPDGTARDSSGEQRRETCHAGQKEVQRDMQARAVLSGVGAPATVRKLDNPEPQAEQGETGPGQRLVEGDRRIQSVLLVTRRLEGGPAAPVLRGSSP
jgi:hypothetical protein